MLAMLYNIAFHELYLTSINVIRKIFQKIKKILYFLNFRDSLLRSIQNHYTETILVLRVSVSRISSGPRSLYDDFLKVDDKFCYLSEATISKNF